MNFAALDLSISAVLHYSDGRGGASRRAVTINKIAIVDGDLQFEGYCHLRKAPRAFLGRRILDLAHGDTGEVISPIDFAAPLLGTTPSEIAARISKKLTERVRTAEVGISFGQDGLAEGWAFGVPDAFRAALDIRLMTYVETVKGPDGTPKRRRYRQWTRGVPPARSFDVGDRFYEPPQVRAMRWDEALPLLKRSVEVTRSLPDDLVDGSCIVIPGDVQFIVRHYHRGELIGSTRHRSTHEELEDFLRTGLLPA